MIEKMTRYRFVLLSGDKDEFLSTLQRLGVVDVTRSTKPVDETSSALLHKATRIKEALGKLETLETPEGTAKVEVHTEDIVESTFDLLARRDDLKGRIAALSSEISSLENWGEFDPDSLLSLEKEGLKVRFYKVATKKFDPAWAGQQPLKVVSEDKVSTYFVTVSPDKDYSFPLQEIPAPRTSPSKAKLEKAKLEGEKAQVEGKLLSLKDRCSALKAQYDGMCSSMDFYLADAGKSNAVEDLVNVFEGFVPTDIAQNVEKEVDSLPVYYLREEATTEVNPPIKFRNNSFVRMFEVLTDMYGRPEYNGFDPTPFISVFFLLFFAFCMGDCGYGLILVLFGLLMKKSDSFKGMAGLVTTLGIGTVVIGFIFHTFFSVDISTWGCIPDFLKKIMLPGKIAGYDGTMVLALIVGIVHLCLAMIVKTYIATRNNGLKESLGTWGWTLLVVGGVVVAALAIFGVLGGNALKWTVIVLGAVSALGIFVFNNIHRNVFANIGSGLWDTYNTATGLLGDVLSYLRLYALGLAGSMLGLAFNNIGQMVLGDGSNYLMWIFFALIVLVGHTLNIAMCALGAFVHPLRLNFLEFFKNSGYEGSGRNYNPLGGEKA